MTYTLNRAEYEALIEAVETGIREREYYLEDGNPAADYGDEWPAVASRQATTWRAAAAAMRRLNADQTALSCESLAEEFAASAKIHQICNQQKRSK